MNTKKTSSFNMPLIFEKHKAFNFSNLMMGKDDCQNYHLELKKNLIISCLPYKRKHAAYFPDTYKRIEFRLKIKTS